MKDQPVIPSLYSLQKNELSSESHVIFQITKRWQNAAVAPLTWCSNTSPLSTKFYGNPCCVVITTIEINITLTVMGWNQSSQWDDVNKFMARIICSTTIPSLKPYKNSLSELVILHDSMLVIVTTLNHYCSDPCTRGQ